MERHSLILFTIIISLLSTTTLSHGASILFYFGISTYSHRIVVWPLVEQLSARGHDVTFLSPFPPKKPIKNVTEFHPKSLVKFMETAFIETDIIQVRLDGGSVATWNGLQESGIGMCEVLMKDPEYLNLVKTKKFDLVIIDALNNECALGIVHQQKSSYIIFDTTHVFMWQPDKFGFPAETSWISDLAIGYSLPMTFTQRFYNTMRPLLWYFGKVYDMYPRLEAIMNEGFQLSKENSIHLADMELNCSLVFTNSHFSLDNARSLPPLVVPVGGLHIQTKPTELPKDIKKFIDESENGFIYISFGSMAQIAKANRDIQKALFYAIGNTTTRFVWKWEADAIPVEMPKNVITAKWMPQNDILAHPKIKAFVTHGGLLGIEEATYFGVPLIAFPVFAEQDYNSERLERIGYGVRLEFKGLTQKHVQDALEQVLTNPRYKEKMHEVSTLFKDRQVDPLQTAVWWTEYVLRNKNTEYLIPLGRHQTWYTKRLIDVWAAIIGPIFLLLGILIGCKLKGRQNPSPDQRNTIRDKKTK